MPAEDFNIGKLREFVALTRKKKSLNEELKKVTQQIEAMQEWMVDHFVQVGIPKLTVTGSDGFAYTCYPRREVHVSAAKGSFLLVEEILKDEQMRPLLSYSPQRLRSWMSDLAGEAPGPGDDADEDWQSTKTVEELKAALPEKIRGLVNVTESFKIGVRKA